MLSKNDARGLVDTNIIILRQWIPAEQLPQEIAISAITLAELSAGPHYIVENTPEAITERARRTDILARVEHEFDPIPFDASAARVFGQLTAAELAAGRTPRRRIADLMIAACAAANQLPLYTTNPDDFVGLEAVVKIRAVPRPQQTTMAEPIK